MGSFKFPQARMILILHEYLAPPTNSRGLFRQSRALYLCSMKLVNPLMFFIHQTDQERI